MKARVKPTTRLIRTKFVSPIEHVVVLMLENRSFDHIFGYRPGVTGPRGDEYNLLDPTQSESDKNPAFYVSNGAPYAVLAGEGPGHSLNAANVQLANSKLGPSSSSPAKNNGFISSYHTELVYADHVKNPSPEVLRVAMESFAPRMLPALNALADEFCVCDSWYSEVPGPTQPNRLYVHAATSFGNALNVWSQKFQGATIYDQLSAEGKTWATYQFDDNEVLEFTRLTSQKSSFRSYETSFASDVKNATLPHYSFIMPRFMNDKQGNMANSQHAPQDARYGDDFVADVYEALVANPVLWQKTALIVTYDEHGGFFDHIIPPASGIPNPDGINSPPPGNKLSYAPSFAFDRLGFRVPAVIASPWIRAGRIDSTRYQHTSIMATVRKLFGLKAKPLTKRDASAITFEGLFGELHAARTDTPTSLPRPQLPEMTLPADHPGHPANQPLDATQRDVLHRAVALTRESHPDGPYYDALPTTQGEASEFIKRRYARHFGLPHLAHGKPARPAKPRRRRVA